MFIQCFTSILLDAIFSFPEISATFPAGTVTDTTVSVSAWTDNEYRALDSSFNLHETENPKAQFIKMAIVLTILHELSCREFHELIFSNIYIYTEPHDSLA